MIVIVTINATVGINFLRSVNVHILPRHWFHEGSCRPRLRPWWAWRRRVPPDEGRYHSEIILQIIFRRGRKWVTHFVFVPNIYRKSSAAIIAFSALSHAVCPHTEAPLRMRASARTSATARIAHKASITTSCLRQSSLQFACRRRLHLHTVYYRASSSAGVTLASNLGIYNTSSFSRCAVGEREREREESGKGASGGGASLL